MQRHPFHRVASACVVTALVAASLITATTAVAADPCRARNLTTGAPASSDLQGVIDAASPGDTIQVKYRCIGEFSISKDLTIVGEPTARVPKPILDSGPGPVITTQTFQEPPARLTLTNLVIRGGDGVDGGGLHIVGTEVTLNRTIVENNFAQRGGGIYNDDGAVILNDSRVVDNDAGLHGAGIYSSGPITMNGLSRVNLNKAAFAGGGIYMWDGAALVMNGNSEVRRNSSGGRSSAGGGMFVESGPVTLNDASSVSRNLATGPGGGIFLGEEGGPLVMNDTSLVTENRADGLGGGVFNDRAMMVMNDSSSVRSNTSRLSGGGGIVNGLDATLIMNDEALVVGNTAGSFIGGGILLVPRSTLFLNGSASVIGNVAPVGGGLASFNTVSQPTVVVGVGWLGEVSANEPDDCEPDGIIAGCT